VPEACNHSVLLLVSQRGIWNFASVRQFLVVVGFSMSAESLASAICGLSSGFSGSWGVLLSQEDRLRAIGAQTFNFSSIIYLLSLPRTRCGEVRTPPSRRVWVARPLLKQERITSCLESFTSHGNSWGGLALSQPRPRPPEDGFPAGQISWRFS